MFRLYADLLFRLPLAQSYSYEVPVAWEKKIQVGMLVQVSLRHKEEELGIVEKLHRHPPTQETLPLDKILYEEALVNEEQIALAHWMSDYYLCHPGEALFIMFPKATKKLPKKKHISPQPIQIQHQLNSKQERIYQKIQKEIHDLDQEKEIGQKKHLLHGITGSGKTEIYIYLIHHILSLKKSALLLVPEISLTVQLIQRLEKVFGTELALLHSGMKASQRFTNYCQILREEKKIVVGTRSAVFAPLKNLSLIIIDEEHDSSFKNNSTPRYDARQIALKRIEEKKSLLLLGSATPRLESYYHSQSSLFQLHSLSQRAQNMSLGEVELHPVSSPETIIGGSLLREIESNLKRKEQSILLLNRRGYYPQVYSTQSKRTELCPACSVSLNLHKNSQLVCHYCGYERFYNGNASDGGPAKLLGTGTQKLEDFLLARFPQARIERLDRDSVSQRSILEDTLTRFLGEEIDILVGTQMIAQGLDAPKLTLVGVLQAERNLYLPDFRAAEKTFSLLTQVAGRTGRSHRKGRAIFECFHPENPILQAAAKQDYRAFYEMEIPTRQIGFYPPYSRIIRLLGRSTHPERIRNFMSQLGEVLRDALFSHIEAKEVQILGPAPPSIEKIHNKFREHIIIKSKSFLALRPILQEIILEKKIPKLHAKDYLEIDIDPADIL